MLIIDGYNLLFNPAWESSGRELEEQREHLIDKIIKFRREVYKKRLIIVFDGRGFTGYSRQKSFHRGGIEIVYASDKGGADDRIVQLTKEINSAQVVTEDRQLAQRARSCGASILTPESFMSKWREDKFIQENKELEKKTPEHVSEADVDFWLEEFGLHEEIPIPKTTSLAPIQPLQKKKGKKKRK